MADSEAEGKRHLNSDETALLTSQSMGCGAVGEDTAGIPLLLCLGGTDADPKLTLEDRRGSRVYGTEKFNLGHVESEAMKCQREMLMEMLMEIWQSKSWHQRRVRYQSRNLGTHQFCNPSEKNWTHG